MSDVYVIGVIDRIVKIIKLDLCKICFRWHDKETVLAQFCFKFTKSKNILLHLTSIQRESLAKGTEQNKKGKVTNEIT